MLLILALIEMHSLLVGLMFAHCFEALYSVLSTSSIAALQMSWLPVQSSWVSTSLLTVLNPSLVSDGRGELRYA